MPRIIAIDYGLKRTGLAVTDPLQIIATGLSTVPSKELIPFLKLFFKRNSRVDHYRRAQKPGRHGYPCHPFVEKCIKELQKFFPAIPVQKVDERYTSKMAKQAMIDMGMKKMQRRNKAIVDEIAATILLQEYMRNP